MTYNPSPAPRGLLDIRAFDASIRQSAASLGGLIGGVIGGMGADELLPSRKTLGTGLLNSFKAYGKDPFYGMP